MGKIVDAELTNQSARFVIIHCQIEVLLKIDIQIVGQEA